MTFLRYLRALFGHTAGVLTGGAAAFLIGLLEHLRGASIASGYYLAIVGCGFLWSGYKAWSVEYREVQRLNALVTQRPRAELAIYPERNCRFYVEVGGVAGEARESIRGVYLQLDLSIENKGEQAANLRRFRVFVREFDKTWDDIRPQQRDAIQTKRSLHGLNTEWMNTGDAVIVPGHSVKKGILSFYLDHKPAPYPNAISVTLSATDTDGTTTQGEFEIPAIEVDEPQRPTPSPLYPSGSGDPQGWMA